MKFDFLSFYLLLYFNALMLVDFFKPISPISMEKSNLQSNNNNQNNKKNQETIKELLLNKNLKKNKVFLNSKAKLEAIKNQILKSLNEFQKLNKIIIDFEDVESSKNASFVNITSAIDLNQYDPDALNDTIIINQKFCKLKKLNKNKTIAYNNTNPAFHNYNSIYENRSFDENINLHANIHINNNLTSNSQNYDYRKYNNFTRQNHTIKIGALNNKNKTSTKDQIIQSQNNNSNNNNSITSDDLLNLIADQTESIKNEICNNCLEINSALNILIEEIKNIKMQLKKLTSERLSKKDAYEKFSYCINNINLIKADLFKLNEILDTLQKANCSNFMDNSKKYTLVVNSTNKLVEIIQNVIRKLNLNINLVVLN